MSNKEYIVEYVKWDEFEEDWDEEQMVYGLTGIQAMKKIQEFMEKRPNARDARIMSDLEDGMFISLVKEQENGDEYWISAYSRDK